MGIFSYIAEKKEAHKWEKLSKIKRQTAIMREDAELQHKIYDAKIEQNKIQKELMQKKELAGPNKLQLFASGLTKTINAAQKQTKEIKVKVGVPKNRTNKNVTEVTGSVFDFANDSPFKK